ncbi:hypothetical protein [Tardiphaga sp. P5_C7]
MTENVTITAAEGQVLTVRIQRANEKASVVTTQGFDADGNPTMVQSFGPKVTTWPDERLDRIVSEARTYDIDATQRLVVEVVPVPQL